MASAELTGGLAKLFLAEDMIGETEEMLQERMEKYVKAGDTMKSLLTAELLHAVRKQIKRNKATTTRLAKEASGNHASNQADPAFDPLARYKGPKK